MAKRLTPGYIEPYAAGLLLAQLVWRDPNRRSDAMVYMRIAYDKGDLRGDWKPSYPPGKGKVHEGDLSAPPRQAVAANGNGAPPNAAPRRTERPRATGRGRCSGEESRQRARSSGAACPPGVEGEKHAAGQRGAQH